MGIKMRRGVLGFVFFDAGEDLIAVGGVLLWGRLLCLSSHILYAKNGD